MHRSLRQEHAASRQQLVVSHTAAARGHEATVAALREEHAEARKAGEVALATSRTQVWPEPANPGNPLLCGCNLNSAPVLLFWTT